MIRIVQQAASRASTSERIYVRPKRYAAIGDSQHCAWVYEDDDEFAHTGKRSIKCRAPVYYVFGGLHRPTYYCKTHGDFIIARAKSPKEARKHWTHANMWRGR